jgi:hypothetical protein
LVDSLLDDLAAMARVFDIAGYEHGLAALAFDELLDLFRLIVLAEIGDQQVCALPRIRDRDARPIPLSPPVITAFIPFSRPDPL